MAVPVDSSALGWLGSRLQARRGARRSRGALRVLHGAEGNCECEGGCNRSVWFESRVGCGQLGCFFNVVISFLSVSGVALFS